MHGAKSAIALLVALVGLVAYIYFVDRERTPGDTEALAKAFEVSPENIEEVQLRNVAGETSRVQRIDTSWQLTEPEKTAADATAVASLTSSLAGLEVQRVVDENPTDLTQYGLNPPRLEVAFRVRGETDFQRLLIGETTPTGGDMYAKTPDQSRVFLISAFLENTFNRTAFDLRDKEVLKFDRDAMTGLELVRGGQTMVFNRKAIEWTVSQPITGRADYALLESLITRVTSSRMQMLVAADATDLRQYGLDRPTLTLSMVDGSSRATLLIGSTGPDGRYAKDASRPMVFTIEEALVTDLDKDLSEFRRKDLFDSRSFNTTRIELRRGTETFTFEKTTADGTDVWRNASGATVDTAKVDDLLTKLSLLRAQSFDAAAHPSLGTPALTAAVRFDDNRNETITIGRAGTDVYASRPDEPGSMRLDVTAFEEAMTSLDALR